MENSPLPTKLNWTKKAFERSTQINHEGQLVGEMKRQDLFSHDVQASLYDTHVRFDVTGFLVHDINVHNVSNADEIIGSISISFGKKATLTLKNGEVYVWKRANMLMKEWHLIHDLPNTDNDPEVVDYVRTRHLLFGENGEINILEKPTSNTELLVLTGLFIRNYFVRRRRMAAAMAAS